MAKCNRTRKSPSSTPNSPKRDRQGIVAVTVQLLLVLILAATVVGVLHLDSRLYFGIDADGQPLYDEIERPLKQQPDFTPVADEVAGDRHDNASDLDIESPRSDLATPGPEIASRRIPTTDS